MASLSIWLGCLVVYKNLKCVLACSIYTYTCVFFFFLKVVNVQYCNCMSHLPLAQSEAICLYELFMTLATLSCFLLKKVKFPI